MGAMVMGVGMAVALSDTFGKGTGISSGGTSKTSGKARPMAGIGP